MWHDDIISVAQGERRVGQAHEFPRDSRPSDEQRKHYAPAYSQVHYNMDLLRPGMTFREFADRAWTIPDQYIKNRYCCLAHGIGMVDVYPSIAHQVDWDSAGYDGRSEAGMTVCVESYIGAKGGTQGVKLEQQVVIGEGGSYRSPVAASRRTGVELHRVETSRPYRLLHAQSELQLARRRDE